MFGAIQQDVDRKLVKIDLAKAKAVEISMEIMMASQQTE